MICGVDEAGRGPLAGPVFAAAVILRADHGIVGLDDSKKLSARQREDLAQQVKRHAVCWAVSSASVEEIDSINILQATLLAMQRAVDGLTQTAQIVLVDGLYCPNVKTPCKAIVDGDATVAEIAAASILAKTARDAAMMELHALFPAYGFDRHKGYGTAEHVAALYKYGVSAAHRRTFDPVWRLVHPSLFDETHYIDRQPSL